MKRDVTTNVKNELVSLSQRMDSADLIFADLLSLLALFKYRPVCFTQEKDAQ